MTKRIFDLCMALLGLIMLSPLLILTSIVISMDSTGPVFFRQARVGLNGKTFFIHKFRTMAVVQPTGSMEITVGNDLRITRVGHLLRKYKIDELPQLIDVLQGTMSLVGPRPEVPKYVAMYPSDIKAKVLSVRPGITDLASIEYKDENALLAKSANPEDTYINTVMPAKLQYCVQYVDCQSMWLDIKIIFRTLKAVFF